MGLKGQMRVAVIVAVSFLSVLAPAQAVPSFTSPSTLQQTQITKIEGLIDKYQSLEAMRLVIMSGCVDAGGLLTPATIDRSEHRLLERIRTEAARLNRLPDEIERFLLAHDEE